jgi:hypothetical protein
MLKHRVRRIERHTQTLRRRGPSRPHLSAQCSASVRYSTVRVGMDKPPKDRGLLGLPFPPAPKSRAASLTRLDPVRDNNI